MAGILAVCLAGDHKALKTTYFKALRGDDRPTTHQFESHVTISGDVTCIPVPVATRARSLDDHRSTEHAIVHKIVIFDSNGQPPRRGSLICQHLKSECHCTIVCYSVASRSTFEEVPAFIAEARQMCRRGVISSGCVPDDVPVVVLALDANHPSPVVPDSEGAAVAAQHGCPFFSLNLCTATDAEVLQPIITLVSPLLSKLAGGVRVPLCTQ